MAWAKVDDQWFAHRKVVTLSLTARGLWTTVLSWSCAQRSPHVPAHMVAFLAGGAEVNGPVRELVSAGLWIECHDGWEIHDWAEYQDKSTAEKRADAGAKGGKKSGETRRDRSKTKQANEANAKQTKQTNEANAEAGTHPVPSLPDPTQSQTHVAPDGDDVEDSEPTSALALVDAPTQTDDLLDEFGAVYPRHRDNGKPWGGGSKQRAKQRWQKLSDTEKHAALVGAGHYAADVQAREAPVKHADGWLSERRWEQWQEPATPPPRRTSGQNRGVDHAARYREAAAELERQAR